MRRLKVRFNSPAVLVFSLLAVTAYFVGRFAPRLTFTLFSAPPSIAWAKPLDWIRLFAHVLGHASWGHLLGNLAYILLLGPLLEEKYGTRSLALMMAATALLTALLNAALFSTAVLGASGIVFMFIVLASMSDMRRGTIPLTFILVAVIFLGGELVNALRADNVSQSSHLIGGSLGAAFGSLFRRRRL